MATPDDEERLEKLAAIERHAWEIIDAPHYHMHDGAPVADPRTGEPLRDDGPLLSAMDALLKVLDLRARILGLYQPERHELIGPDGTTLDVTELAQVLGLPSRLRPGDGA